MTAEQEMELITKVELTHQAIVGNGVKGLADRMGDLEEWRARHPRVCPMERPRKSVTSTRVAEATVMATVIAGLDFLMRVLHVLK